MEKEMRRFVEDMSYQTHCIIDLKLRGVVISGLTLNTEYLLDFRVKFYKEEAAGPTFKRLATRRARTKYFSTLTKMRCFELSG